MKTKLKNANFRRKFVGYILIIIGIMIPLYAFVEIAYGYLSADGRYQSFQSDYASAPENMEKALKVAEETSSYNESLDEEDINFVDPFTNDAFAVHYNRDDKDIFGYLIIDKLDIKEPIYLGASYQNLAKGVCHVYGTNLPVGGESTRSVIAGHRGFYKDIFFLNLGELEDGDEFVIDLGYDKMVYRVKDREIIKPWEIEKLSVVEGEDMVTLLTCDPIVPPSPNRLLINATRVKKETIKTEKKVEDKASEESFVVTQEEKPDKKTNYLKLGVYAISIFGLLALVFVLYRFITFIKNFKEEEE